MISKIAKGTWGGALCLALGACSWTIVDAANDCEMDDDCSVVGSEACAYAVCESERCSTKFSPPTETCSSPDPDGEGVAKSGVKSFQCWAGACCFGCIVDSNGDGLLNAEDGPCVSGMDDQFCGTSEGVCADCSLTGAKCIHGVCVKNGCDNWTDCPDSTNECMVSECVNGHCGAQPATDGALCLAADGSTGACLDGSCTCPSCDDDNECTHDHCDSQGWCSHPEKTYGTICNGTGHCFGGECCSQCYDPSSMSCVANCPSDEPCAANGVCPP